MVDRGRLARNRQRANIYNYLVDTVSAYQELMVLTQGDKHVAE